MIGKWLRRMEKPRLVEDPRPTDPTRLSAAPLHLPVDHDHITPPEQTRARHEPQKEKM